MPMAFIRISVMTYHLIAAHGNDRPILRPSRTTSPFRVPSDSILPWPVFLPTQHSWRARVVRLLVFRRVLVQSPRGLPWPAKQRGGFFWAVGLATAARSEESHV